jgi:hypothetical protein
MDLRCKVFRAVDAVELEAAINRFLGEELPALGEVQFEEISQSEGPAGITVTIWFSIVEVDEESLDELEGTGPIEGPKELA